MVPVAIAALVTGVLACLLERSSTGTLTCLLERSSTGTLVCPGVPLDTGVLPRLLVALISGVLVWLPAPSIRGAMLVTLAGTGSTGSSEYVPPGDVTGDKYLENNWSEGTTASGGGLATADIPIRFLIGDGVRGSVPNRSAKSGILASNSCISCLQLSSMSGTCTTDST